MKNTRTTYDGAKIYSRFLLGCYDFIVYRVLSLYVWRCHPQHFFNFYKDNMSNNHADVGVGTGYLLNQCPYQPGRVRIGLFDLQPNCLAYTANRLARFRPETFQRDALERAPFLGQKFNSIALGGILHCIPGTFAEKGGVFDSVQSLMLSGGHIFGYTILNREIHKTWLSRFVYCLLYRLKVINASDDSVSQLKTELSKRFNRVNVEVVGCIAFFSASESFFCL